MQFCGHSPLSFPKQTMICNNIIGLLLTFFLPTQVKTLVTRAKRNWFILILHPWTLFSSRACLIRQQCNSLISRKTLRDRITFARTDRSIMYIHLQWSHSMFYEDCQLLLVACFYYVLQKNRLRVNTPNICLHRLHVMTVLVICIHIMMSIKRSWCPISSWQSTVHRCMF